MAEDIGYFLSGGATNTDPNASLGGLPSSVELKSGLNTLFSQVTSTEAESGGTRYRCIYLANNTSDEIFNVTTTSFQTNPLSPVEIGISSANEVQLISILGPATGGTFKLKYTINVDGGIVSQTTSEITWVSSQTTTSQNIQDAINLLTYLSNVIITPAVVAGGCGYSVVFSGENGNRAQNILELVDFSVSGATGSSVTRTTPGGPINQVAASTGFENQPPFGVTFGTKLNIGSMQGGDVCGLWIKRTTPAGTTGTTQTVDQDILQTLYAKKI